MNNTDFEWRKRFAGKVLTCKKCENTAKLIPVCINKECNKIEKEEAQKWLIKNRYNDIHISPKYQISDLLTDFINDINHQKVMNENNGKIT